MQNYFARLAAALLTFVLGLVSARVTNFPHENYSPRAATENGFMAAPEMPQERPWPETRSLEMEGDDTKPLAFHGYLVKRFHKSLVIDDVPEKIKPYRVDCSFARLLRHGKTVATFDGNCGHPLGNETNYGLVSVLGPGTQQLAICQSAWRNEEYWFVNWAGQTIFHTNDWFALGDSIRLIDFDGDGVDELVLESGAFYDLQDKLYIGRLPRPELIFKYDQQARKYLPANLRYPDYLLRNNDVSKQVEPPDDLSFAHRGGVLKIMLGLIYAGKSDQGWKFYDSTYKVSDKEDLRKRVQADLSEDPYYQWLLKHSPPNQNSHQTNIREIDFDNFRYPDTFDFAPGYSWFDLRGRIYNPPPLEPSNDTETVALYSVAYGDVTGDSQEEAIVILTQSIRGTAIPHFVYVVTMVEGHPKVISSFPTGDRAEGGLSDVRAEAGKLVIELNGRGSRIDGAFHDDGQGACCPVLVTRMRYTWTKDGFKPVGNEEIFPK